MYHPLPLFFSLLWPLSLGSPTQQGQPRPPPSTNLYDLTTALNFTAASGSSTLKSTSNAFRFQGSSGWRMQVEIQEGEAMPWIEILPLVWDTRLDLLANHRDSSEIVQSVYSYNYPRRVATTSVFVIGGAAPGVQEREITYGDVKIVVEEGLEPFVTQMHDRGSEPGPLRALVFDQHGNDLAAFAIMRPLRA